VTGGYGGPGQGKGTVSEEPSPHHAQRLEFRFP
jgi:hypothetical protein